MPKIPVLLLFDVNNQTKIKTSSFKGEKVHVIKAVIKTGGP